MSTFWKKADEFTMVGAAIGCMPLLIVLAIIVGAVRSCSVDEPNPIDNTINISREIVELVYVMDTSYCGFYVAYATVHNVSKKRLEEIQSRPHIRESFQRMRDEIPNHFEGSLLYVDIYDFAEVAKKYDIDSDIKIQNIFVHGKEKVDLYAQPNPNIPNCATWINPNTQQGVQYLKSDDIYYCNSKNNRVYRYWKCQGNNSTSYADERYSHFSEDERLW